MPNVDLKSLVYPFNPYGTDPAAVVRNEEHTLTPVNGQNYVTIVPRCAPFFRTTMKIINTTTNKELVENRDYTVGYLFNELSQKTYKGLYGCITFTNLSGPTNIKLTEYSTIGYNFVLNDTDYAKVIANLVSNPRVIFWEQIVDTPKEYPPIDHTHPADETLNYQGYIDQMGVAATNIMNAIDSYLKVATDHIDARGNVHGLTLDTLGLSHVRNFPIAEVADIPSWAANKYASLAIVRAGFMNLFAGLPPNVLDSSVSGEVMEAKSTVELLNSLNEAGLMIDSEKANLAEWRTYLGSLLVKAFNQATTPVSKPARNGIFARLLGG